jgi:hypothetical protein
MINMLIKLIRQSFLSSLIMQKSSAGACLQMQSEQRDKAFLIHVSYRKTREVSCCLTSADHTNQNGQPAKTS